MTYTIHRDGQDFGPYSLADLQHYLSTGDVLPTDLARSEGMEGYLPVSQIVGTIPVPFANTTIPAVPLVEYPDPPNLHWGLVLLFGVITFGFFSTAWGIVISHWMRKVNPESKAIFYYWAHAVTLALIFFARLGGRAAHSEVAGGVLLLQIVSFVLSLTARYTLRSSLEEHFNTAEPIGLSLSGVMTFFFGDIYFQYHLNAINRSKQLARASAY
jgi:hypothetical protein